MNDTHLPINQRFENLDEYLTFLETSERPIGRSWYREVKPGVFELQTGNFRPLGQTPAKQTFTRAELEKKFGFSH